MALVNLKSFAIKNVVSLGFNLILARQIETKGDKAVKGVRGGEMTKEERQDYSSSD